MLDEREDAQGISIILMLSLTSSLQDFRAGFRELTSAVLSSCIASRNTDCAEISGFSARVWGQR